MFARTRAFLESSYQGYYEKDPFRCPMFLMVTALFALTMASAGAMLARQWHLLAWPRSFEIVLIVIMTLYPWLFELRAHSQIRRLLREKHESANAEAAKRAAAYTLSGLAFAYAIVGWAFAFLARARIH